MTLRHLNLTRSEALKECQKCVLHAIYKCTHLFQLRLQHHVGWNPISVVPLVLCGPGVQTSTCSCLVGRTTSSHSVGNMPTFLFLLNFTQALGQTGVLCSLGAERSPCCSVWVGVGSDALVLQRKTCFGSCPRRTSVVYTLEEIKKTYRSLKKMVLLGFFGQVKVLR